ncbi:hypothetical protein KJZ61_02460 [Candidatus Dependentiae bacterium]|nr:hypothetical protein [Candidatus Dependentiae bacterium]
MRYTSFLMLIAVFHPTMHAEIGCMSKSYKLAKNFDHKQYHYVKCECPCKQYPHYFHKGYRCSKCGHAHDPQLTAFVRDHYSTAGSAAYNPIHWELTQALALASAHKNHGISSCNTDTCTAKSCKTNANTRQ